MEGPLPRDIVRCIIPHLEEVWELFPLMRVNRFWKRAVIQFAVTLLNEERFNEEVEPFARKCLSRWSEGGESFSIAGVFNAMKANAARHGELFTWFMLAICHDIWGDKAEELRPKMDEAAALNLPNLGYLLGERLYYEKRKQAAFERGMQLIYAGDDSVFATLGERHAIYTRIALFNRNIAQSNEKINRYVKLIQAEEAERKVFEDAVADEQQKVERCSKRICRPAKRDDNE